MDSTWIPGKIIQRKKSNKIKKKIQKILWPWVHKNYDIMLCQNEVSSKYICFNNQWPLMYHVQLCIKLDYGVRSYSTKYHSWHDIVDWWSCKLLGLQLGHAISMTISPTATSDIPTSGTKDLQYNDGLPQNSTYCSNHDSHPYQSPLTSIGSGRQGKWSSQWLHVLQWQLKAIHSLQLGVLWMQVTKDNGLAGVIHVPVSCVQRW